MPSGRNAIGTVAGTALRAACFVFGTLCFSSLSAYANEVVTLADNTQIAGKLTHYFDGVVVMETSGGQKLELPRDKDQVDRLQAAAAACRVFDAGKDV